MPPPARAWRLQGRYAPGTAAICQFTRPDSEYGRRRTPTRKARCNILGQMSRKIMVDTVKCSKWCSSSMCTRFSSSSTVQSTGMGLGSSRGRDLERGSAPRCDPEREGTHCSRRLTQFPQGSASSHLTVRQLLPGRKREGREWRHTLTLRRLQRMHPSLDFYGRPESGNKVRGWLKRATYPMRSLLSQVCVVRRHDTEGGLVGAVSDEEGVCKDGRHFFCPLLSSSVYPFQPITG